MRWLAVVWMVVKQVAQQLAAGSKYPGRADHCRGCGFLCSNLYQRSLAVGASRAVDGPHGSRKNAQYTDVLSRSPVGV